MALKDTNAVFKQWIAAYAAHDAEKIMAVFDKTLVYSSQGEGLEDRSDHRLLGAEPACPSYPLPRIVADAIDGGACGLANQRMRNNRRP